MTVKNRAQLPLIRQMVDRIRGSKYFTKLDLRGTYTILRITARDEWTTAFRTRYGHLEYQVLSLGPCSAPATFPSAKNDILLRPAEVRMKADT